MVKVNSPSDAPGSAETEAKVKTPEQLVEETGETQVFDGTIIKIDADGNEVMSDHLLPGETLRRDATDLYYLNPAQAKFNDEEHRASAKRDAKASREQARVDEAKNKQ